MRPVVALVAAAVLATACAGAGDVVEDVASQASTAADDVASAVDDAASDVEQQPSGEPGPTTGEPAPTGGAPAPPEPTSTPTRAPATTPVDDDGPLGANALAMLRGDRPRLVLEVDVQSGAALSQAALDHLVDELSRHLDKSEITFAGANEVASDDESWTVDDLRAAVAENRTTASDDQQVSVHVLVLRGGFAGDDGEGEAIGLAYGASTVALWPGRADGIGGVLGSREGVERAVLVHELGHLLGLVNLVYESDIDHEDPEHPGHSSSQGSVMFHAVETTLVGQVFGGPPPDRFDDADASDLEGLRTGRLVLGGG